MNIKLIYPETRIVHEEKILAWAEDAFRNGDTNESTNDVQRAIELLEDVGLITVDHAWTERRN